MNINREEFRKITKDRKSLEMYLAAYAHEVLEQATKEYGAVMALTLRDELDFGPLRGMRFLERFNDRMKDIKAGRLSVDDVLATVGEEMNIKLV